MNWYERNLIDTNIFAYIEDSLFKFAIGGEKGGWNRSVLTPRQEETIKNMFAIGKSTKEISQILGLNDSNGHQMINRFLIRNRLIQAKDPLSVYDQGYKKPSLNNLTSKDPNLISNILKLIKTKHPIQPRNYNTGEIAQMVGVSYQTVQRILAKHGNPTTEAELLRAFMYVFWNKYNASFKNYMAKLPQNKKLDTINKLIDSLLFTWEIEQRNVLKNFFAKQLSTSWEQTEVSQPQLQVVK